MEQLKKTTTKEFKILSIIRKVDGKLFDINQEVKVCGIVCRIKSFNIFGNNNDLMCVSTDKGNLGFNGTGPNISELRYVNDPLFITEDEVHINEGDEYWVCVENSIMQPRIFKVNNASCTHRGDIPGNKYFSTRKAAELYRFNNQKSLSLNDVRSILRPKQSYQYHDTTIAELTKLIERNEK